MRTQLSGLLYIRMQGVHISQGSGQLIKFWKNVRCGETSLREIYPRLVSISTQKTVKVYDLVMQGDRSQWNFTFRRRLFQWEEEQLQEIKTEIGFQISPGRQESLRWQWEPGWSFLLNHSTENESICQLILIQVLVFSIFFGETYVLIELKYLLGWQFRIGGLQGKSY